MNDEQLSQVEIDYLFEKLQLPETLESKLEVGKTKRQEKI